MPSAQSLITKVSGAVRKVGPMARTAYKRVTTITGGDELIGRGTTATPVDTLFNPQPIYRQLGHREAMYLSTDALQLVADDFKFWFPVTQVHEADFQNANVTIVLKDGNGDEQFKVLYINSESYKGGDVLCVVFARSIGH